MSQRAARRRAARGDVPPLTGLWLSNAAFAPTGYGTQTRQVVSRMLADGHRIAVLANYGIEAMQTEWEGIYHYPRGYDAYSNDVWHPSLKDWAHRHPGGREAVFTLYDTWVFAGPRWDEVPVVSWVPIDHQPVPPAVASWCAKPNVRPVAMAPFGAAQLAKAGIDCDMIPHGIETSIFTPTPLLPTSTGQQTYRQLIGVEPEQFLVGIVNANKGNSPPRKAFAEQLLAFAMFAQRHPDAVVYIHSEKSSGMTGINFDPLVEAVGLKEHQVRYVNQWQNRIGIDQGVLAGIYSSLDVLLAPTYGEGFGLTVAEAMSCGVPAIVNDFSAQPDIVGDAGWLVQGQPYWDPAQSAWFCIPLVTDMVRALEEAHEARGQRGDEARKRIVDNFDADLVYEQGWRPLLESL